MQTHYTCWNCIGALCGASCLVGWVRCTARVLCSSFMRLLSIWLCNRNYMRMRVRVVEFVIDYNNIYMHLIAHTQGTKYCVSILRRKISCENMRAIGWSDVVRLHTVCVHARAPDGNECVCVCVYGWYRKNWVAAYRSHTKQWMVCDDSEPAFLCARRRRREVRSRDDGMLRCDLMVWSIQPENIFF